MRAFHRIMNMKYYFASYQCSDDCPAQHSLQFLTPLASLIDETLTKTQPGTSPPRRDWTADA